MVPLTRHMLRDVNEPSQVGSQAKIRVSGTTQVKMVRAFFALAKSLINANQLTVFLYTTYSYRLKVACQAPLLLVRQFVAICVTGS